MWFCGILVRYLSREVSKISIRKMSYVYSNDTLVDVLLHLSMATKVIKSSAITNTFLLIRPLFEK